MIGEIIGDGIGAGLRVAGWAEGRVMALLRSRLEATAAQTRPAPRADAPRTDPAPDLRSRMHTLLVQSLANGTVASQEELFRKVLDQIVPDEARIISHLAGGRTATLMSVYVRAGLGSEPVLENMSLIGRTANLGLPHFTPTYVSHLLALGLLEVGPEDPDLKTQYEVLAADILVLGAVKRATRGPVPARVERGTIRLSGLGHELCAATGLTEA